MKLLREPLVHFLLFGAALFAVYGLVVKPAGGAPGAIVVTKGQIASLAAGFEQTWQRPPSPAELEELIQDRVREDVYCREAVALGLDKDDPIIRRRLRQKMEFISEDVAIQKEPTDAELETYLREHADGKVPDLATVRDAARRDWVNARRREANEQAYRRLLAKYTVRIERP